ncbi:MAG: LysR family transcriptional regulator, partial [Candidatus Dormibacteraceae bacterium]
MLTLNSGEPAFNLHKLRVFCEVAERQSVTLAARALFVTQPVVSSHVRDLEQFFGARLFLRSGRRMILTEPGRTVLAYAQDLSRHTAETLTTVRLQESGEAGSVRVGASETPGCYR